eukprot:3542374-Pyramimonas_sp.AAC.1
MGCLFHRPSWTRRRKSVVLRNHILQVVLPARERHLGQPDRSLRLLARALGCWLRLAPRTAAARARRWPRFLA